MSELLKLDGIGPKSLSKLNSMGIHKISELLLYYPRKFKYYDISYDENCCMVGKIITQPMIKYPRRNLSRITFSIVSNEIIYECVLFNRQFLINSLKIGVEVNVTGTIKNGNQVTVSELFFDYRPVRCIYDLKDIPKSVFTKALRSALKYIDIIPESLSTNTISEYKLIGLKDMIRIAHYPKDINEIKHFLRRAKYEELLKYQLMLKYRKNEYERDGVALNIDEQKVDEFVDNLSFKLTDSQTNAISDIVNDLSSKKTMNRLLQGDVGSGKTVIAMAASIAVISAGYQVAFMAPTEVLAEQHFAKLKRHFNVEILSSSRKKERADILGRLAKGSIDIIVGTHALFQEDVIYNNLGLVITDEQHRFGVEQRKKLRAKSKVANVLYMSATPIPRTLSITLFGDMDITSITELPQGRKEIDTRIVKDITDVFLPLTDEIENGRQAYIVTALIEESEKIDLDNAYRVYDSVKSNVTSSVGLLHGRMTHEEKNEVMTKFKTGETSILVSTTVVEVGVDVQNASMMIIIDAHRFGLSQLHQLRGRVGRGEYQSYCYLVSNSKQEKASERLNVIANTSDGFELSEADLRLRGPGDFFGVRQSGFPIFKFADIMDDMKIMRFASEDASKIVYNINKSEYKVYKDFLDKIVIT